MGSCHLLVAKRLHQGLLCLRHAMIARERKPGKLKNRAKKTLLAGCSKTLRYKATEIPRSETYILVRRNDEG
jgi:hypothetical protein